VICEFYYNLENNVTEKMVYGMLFLSRNFVSGLNYTLKSKKN